jgi:biotin transport system substrate-specific component
MRVKAAFLQQQYCIGKVATRVAGVFVFIILTSLAGFVRIPVPFSPVPVTLQTAVVLLAGLCLGGRFGSVAQAGYILLGVAGLPVFSAAGSGWLYLVGPTGGYMLGFVIAAAVAGTLARRRQAGLMEIFFSICLADALILLSGTAWLKMSTGVSWLQGAGMGFAPFIAGDIIKAWVVALIYAKIRRRVDELF